ncbi:hypothetical protein WQQ_38720 [Hydrocarboniphaga effusa AP103]|uniref:Uncharacterized protein n=1 Tax=Hydrocarboniphaga effusa AP103 TaxID=1172194 RepID=I7ZAI2_9GAMM|nr:hypothetical protein WQQ_38720 [Hydrocarboniphaga effusa AP103]
MTPLPPRPGWPPAPEEIEACGQLRDSFGIPAAVSGAERLRMP